MITKLRLRNFQCHEDLRLKLDAVTTIIGNSDRGKSSILRGLRWVLTNKPNGTAFIKQGEKEAKVSVWIDDKKVVRGKGKKNLYQYDGETYTAFGNDVPEPIADFINVKDSINFQTQHDPPFWFTESAGGVAKNLNAIVNLESIDETVSQINKDIRSSRADLKAHQSIAEDLSQKVTATAHVPKMLNDLQAISHLQEQLDLRTPETACIETEINNVKRQGNIAENDSETVSGVLSILQIGEDLQDLAGACDLLESVMDQQAAMPDSGMLLQWREIEQLHEQVLMGTADNNYLSDNLEELLEETNECDGMKREMKTCEQRLNESGRCPTCGKPVTLS